VLLFVLYASNLDIDYHHDTVLTLPLLHVWFLATCRVGIYVHAMHAWIGLGRIDKIDKMNGKTVKANTCYSVASERAMVI